MSDDNENKEKDAYTRRVTRFYATLSIIAVIVMIVAAYITYGYQNQEIHVSLSTVFAKAKRDDSQKTMNITPDLSHVPGDDIVKDILNDVLPHTCKDCDKKPLKCLKEYEINKILIQNPPYQDYLKIELLTGKEVKKVFTIIIDLSNNNQVIYADGEVDKKRCRDVVEEDDDSDDDEDSIFINKGQDPDETHYIETKPREE